MKSHPPGGPDKTPPDEPSAVSRGGRRRRAVIKWSVLVVVAGVCIGLGLWTTYLVEHRLAMGEVRKILPFLSLQRTVNSGVAFGLLNGRLAVILPANALAILVVLAYAFMDRRAVLAGIAGGFIIGGSLGNVIQRLTGDGHVTDFIKLPSWPNFNLPDVFIVVGIVMVFLGLLAEAIRVFRAGNKSPTR